MIKYFIVLMGLSVMYAPCTEAKKKKAKKQTISTINKIKKPLILPGSSFVSPDTPNKATQPLSLPTRDLLLPKDQTSVTLDVTGKGFIAKDLQNKDFGHATMGDVMRRPGDRHKGSGSVQGGMIQHTWKVN